MIKNKKQLRVSAKFEQERSLQYVKPFKKEMLKNKENKSILEVEFDEKKTRFI